MDSVTKVPIQIRSVPLLLSVDDGQDAVEYGRKFLRLWHEAVLSDLTPEIEAWIEAYVPTRAHLALGDADAMLARYPEKVQENVRGLQDALVSLLERTYPLPEGEQILSSRLTVVAEKSGDVQPGTVVYIRQTNAATIQFLLNHLVVDLATAQPRVVGLSDPLVGTPPKPPFATSFAATGAAGGTGLSIALGVASSLVWALPPPWGPVAAAGLSVIEVLLPQGSGIGDLMDQAVQRLEDFIEQQEIERDSARLKALSEWLQQELAVMEKTQAVDNQYMIETIKILRSNTAPGGDNVYTAIYDLENYIQKDGAFEIMVLGVSLYLLGLKMILQLEAQIASNYKNDGDDAAFAQYSSLWLDDYANFQTAIMGGTVQGKFVPAWAKKISDKIDNFYAQRLGQITDVYRYNDQYERCYAGGGGTPSVNCSWYDRWGWTWKDNALGEGDAAHLQADTQQGGDCCSSGHTVEYRDAALADRQNHVNAVSADLDKKYADARGTVRQWMAMIQQWNQHQPPQTPVTAPTIDPAGWAGLPPKDPGWVAGSSVAYAVALANASGPSKPGPYGKDADVKPDAGPTLTNLPGDPLNMATRRWIYRRITTAQGAQKVKIVGIVDVSATTFQDVGKQT